MAKNETSNTSDWLSAELNRMWLIAERTLRTLQKAQVRPQAGHPSLAEVEAVLTARRVARLGASAANRVESEEELTTAIGQFDKQLTRLRAAAPIGRLAKNLGLSDLELEVVSAVIAPQLEAPLATLYAALRGPGARRGTDLALLAQMFRLKRSERINLLDAIDASRPLVHWKLFEVATPNLDTFNSVAHQPVRPSFHLLNLLCGRGELEPSLQRSSTIVSGEKNLDGLLLNESLKANIVETCQAAESKGDELPWLVLWGPTGAGKRTLAARIAAFADRPMVTFDTEALDRGTFSELFEKVQVEALVRGALLYIGPLAAELEADGAKVLMQRLRNFTGMVAIGVNRMSAPRIGANRPMIELEIEVPDFDVRRQLWEQQLPEEVRHPELDMDAVSNSFKMTPGEVIGVAAEAIAVATAEDRKVEHEEVRLGIDRRLRTELGELARRIKPVVTWSDLVLGDQDLARVKELISRKRNRHVVYEEWGYGRRVGYGQGLIALFSGPPGTGKTMLAGLIAKALDLDIYQVDLAQVVSKWVGETEKQLAKVFDQAERAHAVLLFDEADSLFAKRTEVKSSNDRYGNLAVNYLLQRLESYEGVAVLTTNKDAQLDEALQRRLTLHLRLEVPEVPERERLWKTFLPKEAPIASNLDFRELAEEFELSGGYIKNAAVRAAFLAADRGVSIDMGLFKLAAGLELEDMGRVVMRSTSFANDLTKTGFDFDLKDA